MLQEIAEAYIECLMKDANLCAAHVGRDILLPCDIQVRFSNLQYFTVSRIESYTVSPISCTVIFFAFFMTYSSTFFQQLVQNIQRLPENHDHEDLGYPVTRGEAAKLCAAHGGRELIKPEDLIKVHETIDMNV